MKRACCSTALGMLVALVMVACGDDDNQHGSDATAPPDSELMDASAEADGATADAAPPPDGTVSPDAALVDGAVSDSGLSDGAPPDVAPQPDAAVSVCGNGVLETGERCDDGVIQQACDTWHDGGDGACVAPGNCSPGYVPDAGGDCVPAQQTADVWIDVDNFCSMSVTPLDFTVPAGQTLVLTYHNISAWYPVDVWLSYGGGYLDLQTGTIWADQFTHCSGPNPYDAYADIDTACSGYRLYIHCL